MGRMVTSTLRRGSSPLFSGRRVVMGRTVAWTPEQASRFVASTFLGVAGLWNSYSRDDPLVQERAIAGIVVDSAGVPVPWANVTLNGGRRVVTGLDGRFRFRGDSIASATVEVRRIGFHPAAVMVNTWPDTGVRLVLTAVPHSLSAVRVGVARIQSLVSHGFYDRMSEVEKGIGHGYFITPEEMAARPSARVTDLVSRLPAIRIRRIRETTRTGQYGMQIQGVDG